MDIHGRKGRLGIDERKEIREKIERVEIGDRF